jgi:hypothetical protein
MEFNGVESNEDQQREILQVCKSENSGVFQKKISVEF